MLRFAGGLPPWIKDADVQGSVGKLDQFAQDAEERDLFGEVCGLLNERLGRSQEFLLQRCLAERFGTDRGAKNKEAFGAEGHGLQVRGQLGRCD